MRLKMDIKTKLKSYFPWIGSVDIGSIRRQWLAEALLSIPSDSRILDAGAGTQRNRKLCSHLNYVSQDFAQYDGKGDGSGLHIGDFKYGQLDIVSDITNIPEEDCSFDAVMCIEVLEHVPEPISAVKELSRLLKPGGQLILTAPFCSLSHYAPYHFSTGFNKYWYEKHLADNGMVIKEIFPLGNFFDFLRQENYRTINIAQKYTTNKRIGLFSMFLILLLQRSLFKLSLKDQGSSEILCDGYVLRAQKL